MFFTQDRASFGDRNPHPSYSLFWAIISVVIVIIGLMPSSRSAETTNNFAKRFSQLKEISVHEGINDVHFDGIDSDAQIVVGTTFYGDASVVTTDVFMALTKSDDVIPFYDAHNHQQFVVTDQPDTDNGVRAVRFFNGLFDHKPSTLVFIANRLVAYPTFDTPTQITVYVLNKFENDQRVVFWFKTVTRFLAKRKYCEANHALNLELGIPFPPSWGDVPTGSNQSNSSSSINRGC